ncbi:MAG TPA: M1 family aminopeptidase [Pyrinomonadaceae bacterium]|nr:M1 family aminopeptidase [Pyrinomonadaceae bacterium]
MNQPARPKKAWRGASALALILFIAASSPSARAQQPPQTTQTAQTTQTTQTTPASVARTQYTLTLKLDFDARTYTGTQRVRWTNRDDRPTSVLYFHLYPNLRETGGTPTTRAETFDSARLGRPNSSDAATTPAANANNTTPEPDEPHLEVTEVRAVASSQPLIFSVDEQGTSLRVQTREPVAAGALVEIELKFKGSVPEIDPDETSLPAHVIQQVGAALRESREVRRARDINFVSRGVMLLGAPFPLLAVRDGGGEWQRKVEPTVGDMIHAETADYRVSVETRREVAVYTSGDESATTASDAVVRLFTGENLRNFALVAGRTLRAAEREVSGLKVRSVFTAERETIGRRALAVAAEAARVFTARFGALPVKTVSVTEAPLVAGVGSAEFAGLGVIASAFYVDFDSPAMRHLPEIVREQRASVEDSLEFTVAHVIAHEWWGMTVGSDPARAPFLDEALAHWSALLYYKEVRGEERARLAQDDQLRGVYQVYRTFGGEDMPAERAARDYRNSFQYAAIVAGKGALMFDALRRLMGDERFFAALRSYYQTNRLEIAEEDDLRAAFLAEAPPEQRRALTRAFNRWLSEKRGDEDIAPPNPELAAALGLPSDGANAKDRNAFSRLGRFFWRQMTRIR